MTVDLALIGRHTMLLLETARGLDDVNSESLCAGWSRGHVLTHIARNADGLAAGVRSILDGTDETVYASAEQRDADIEAGAHRALPELIADVAASAEELAVQLGRLGPQDGDRTVERVPGGVRVRAGAMPAMRLREVVYHHVDLLGPFTFADIDHELLLRFLKVEMGILEQSKPVPDLIVRTDQGDEWILGDRARARELSGSRADILGHLARALPLTDR